MGLRRPASILGAAAASLCIATLLAYWPGTAMYDSVAQYRQALTGRYDDWHPPAMARVWSLVAGQGGGPMLLLQLAGYWAGLGLLAARLARSGRVAAGLGLLALGCWPPLLGWQAALLKDSQLMAALLPATGIVAWYRLDGRRLPAVATAAVALLLLYALLLRANAAFAVVPLAIAWSPRPRATTRRVALAVIGIAAAIGVAGLASHRLMGAARSGVERTQAIYDLAGIAVRSGDAAAVGLLPGTVDALRAKACVRPYFWDPLGEPSRCAQEAASWRATPPGTLYRMLALAALRHPLDYAGHRLAHLNATGRWLVPARWPGAAPPESSEPNPLGLRDPGAAGAAWSRLGGALVDWPVGWPVFWVLVGALLLVGGWRDARPAAAQARALVVSALSLEASFAALSIASDLRYHLWPMVATVLAAVLAGPAAWRPRAGWLLLAGVVAAGVAARLVLPAVPDTYAGMLGGG